MGVIRECVICCRSEFWDKNNDEIMEIQYGEPNEDCQTLRSQLRAMLVLRSLLNIPQEMCTKFLKENGNPNSWIFWCASCYSTLIRKAANIYHQIKSLEKQFDSVRTDIKKAIVTSARERAAKPVRKPSDEAAEPTQIIRSYIINDFQDKTNILENLLKCSVKKPLDKCYIPPLSPKNVNGASVMNCSKDTRLKNDELKIISTRSLEVNATSNRQDEISPSTCYPEKDDVEYITLESDDECDELPFETKNKESNQSTGTNNHHYQNCWQVSEAEIQEDISATPNFSPISLEEEFSESDGYGKAISQEELEQFAEIFRQRRMALGFNQSQVAISLGNVVGDIISQTTISRFEKLQLSFNNLCKWKPYLQKWLEAAESNTIHKLSLTTSLNRDGKRRRQRTVIEGELKETLENYFAQQPLPSPAELTDIAETFQVEKEVVRIWFCNRRRKRTKEMAAQNDSLPIEDELADISAVNRMNYTGSVPPLIPLYTPTMDIVAPNEDFTSTSEIPSSNDKLKICESIKSEVEEYILP